MKRKFGYPYLGLKILAGAMLLSLCGCFVEPPPRPGPPPAAVIVQKAPPAEIVETVPPPPGPREVWVWQKGHWRWNGSSYWWQQGHWVERPANVGAWVPPHWENRPVGYVFVEGAWH